MASLNQHGCFRCRFQHIYFYFLLLPRYSSYISPFGDNQNPQGHHPFFFDSKQLSNGSSSFDKASNLNVNNTPSNYGPGYGPINSNPYNTGAYNINNNNNINNDISNIANNTQFKNNFPPNSNAMRSSPGDMSTSMLYDRSSRYSLSSNTNNSPYNTLKNHQQQQQQQQHTNTAHLKSQSPLLSANAAATLSPVSTTSSASPMSTSSLMSSSTSTTGSTTADAASSANTITTRNNESNLLTPLNTPNTKTSPFLFSKYIESVHKALHGGANTVPSTNNNNASGEANTDPVNNNNNNNNDDLSDNEDAMNAQSVSKRFVDHRRQLFEKSYSSNLTKENLTRLNEDTDETCAKSPFYFGPNLTR